MDTTLSPHSAPQAPGPRNEHILDLNSTVTAPAQDTAKAPRQLGAKLRLALDLAERCLIKPFSYELRAITLNGPARHSDEAMRVKYIGDGTSYHYLASLCFAGEPKESREETLSLFSLNAALKQQHDCDLLLVDLPMPLNLLSDMPGRVTPHWLKQNIALPASWDDFLKGLRRKTRMEAQRIIRKFELKARIVAGEDYAEEFYDALYAPYTADRHGKSSVIEARDKFLEGAKGSSFIQLLRDGEILAASQLRQSGSSFGIPYVGMDLSLPEKEQFCLVDAMDYFALMHGIELGCTTVDMGHSRANLVDGILKYKKKWGANIHAGVIPKGSLAFKANNCSPAVLAFFQANVLASVQNKQIRAFKLVRDDEDSKKLTSLIKQYEVEGLSTLELLIPAERSEELSTLANERCTLTTYRDSDELCAYLNNNKD